MWQLLVLSHLDHTTSCWPLNLCWIHTGHILGMYWVAMEGHTGPQSLLWPDTGWSDWYAPWTFNDILYCSLCKHDSISKRQTGCPFWGTNRIPFLRDKQDALFEGQIRCPFWGRCCFWGTNRMPFLGMNWMPFLRDKKDALFEGQTRCPFWGTNKIQCLTWNLTIQTLLSYHSAWCDKPSHVTK